MVQTRRFELGTHSITGDTSGTTACCLQVRRIHAAERQGCRMHSLILEPRLGLFKDGHSWLQQSQARDRPSIAKEHCIGNRSTSPAHSHSSLLPKGNFMMSTSKKCYWPNGVEIEDSPPCDLNSSGHSACCLPNAVCLSNGLCWQQDLWNNRLARFGCTDPTWQDNACPRICNDGIVREAT